MSVVMQDLVARSNAYQRLSRCLDDPAAWQPDLANTLTDPFGELDSKLGTRARETADRMRTALEDPTPLKVAYAKLFLGPFEVLAPPYASHYLERDGGILGPVSLAVADAYAEAGVGPGTGPRDAPDHIAHELELMY
ncbi:MAG: TorD/DmsD family molecular chaperone, partial [Planctomycetota bacterium]